MNDQNSTAKLTVVTPEALFSYVHIAEPQRAAEGQKPKYSVALVFAPGTDLSALKAAAMAAAELKWGAKAAAMFKSGALRSPFREDGADKGYEDGSVYINARSENQPGAVYAWADSNGKPARIPQEKLREELYSGCYGRASVRAYAYDKNGNRGVSFALNNVQKLRDGKRIDGRKAPEDEFDVDLNAAPADMADVL